MNAPLRSLVEARSLGPLVMFVTGLLTIVEGALARDGLGAACLFGLGIPTLGTTAIAWLLARQRWGAVALALVGWAAAEGALAIGLGLFEGNHPEQLLSGAAIASGVTFVLAIPGWAFGAGFAERRELDAGDTLLMWSALWFGALHVGYAMFLPPDVGGLLPQLLLVACALLFAVTLVRAILRRRWYARVARGQERGWRVREPSTDERRQLPPLFALGRRACGVIERRGGGAVAPSPYRAELLAEPFALVPLA